MIDRECELKAENARLRAEVARLKDANVSTVKANDLCHDEINRLFNEVERLREVPDVRDHMNACRALLGVPDDEVLYQAILRLKSEVERLKGDLEALSSRRIGR